MRKRKTTIALGKVMSAEVSLRKGQMPTKVRLTSRSPGSFPRSSGCLRLEILYCDRLGLSNVCIL